MWCGRVTDGGEGEGIKIDYIPVKIGQEKEMFSYFQLGDRRYEQMQREVNQKASIEEAMKRCNEDTVRYFLHKRDVYFNHFSKVHHEPFYRQCAVAVKYMDVVDEELNEFDKVVESGDLCEYFRGYGRR